MVSGAAVEPMYTFKDYVAWVINLARTRSETKAMQCGIIGTSRDQANHRAGRLDIIQMF